MPIPHFIKDFWQGHGPRAKQFADWANQVAKLLNGIEGEEPIIVEFTGQTLVIRLAADYTVVPDPPASGFYVLTATDGVMAWEEIVDCAGDAV